MKYIRLMLIMGMMHILLSGCAHQGERAAQLQLRPSASDLHADESEDDGPPHAFNITPDSPAPSDTLGTIDMNQALALALMHNPDLAGFAHQVRSAEGRALQAGMVPNPEVEIEMEEISDAGFDDAVASFLLSQPIELGGKRKKRVQLAHLEAAAARWEYEMTRLDVAASTKKAFTEVIAAQEKVTLALEMILLSEQMVETVSERIDAGRDSPIEEARALTSLASAQIERRKAESDLVTAREHLSSLWGNSAPVFENAQGDLSLFKPVPPFGELSTRVRQNPDIARWDTIIEQSKYTVSLEKAMRIPDLALSAGLEYSNGERETTYRLGLALPLPLFDRNQGGLLEAQSNLLKAEQERDAAAVGVLAVLTEAYQVLVSSHDEAVTLQGQVLPAAERALEGSREGFRRGKYSHLEVIDAQRTLFELKWQYVDALVRYHLARADIERLIAQSLDDV